MSLESGKTWLQQAPSISVENLAPCWMLLHSARSDFKLEHDFAEHVETMEWMPRRCLQELWVCALPQLVSPAASGIVADTVTVEAGLCERPAGEDVPTDPRGSKTESNRGVHGILWHAGAMAWLRVRNSPMSSLRGKNAAVHAMPCCKCPHCSTFSTCNCSLGASFQ